jgi:hypothetical protein
MKMKFEGILQEIQHFIYTNNYYIPCSVKNLENYPLIPLKIQILDKEVANKSPQDVTASFFYMTVMV